MKTFGFLHFIFYYTINKKANVILTLINNADNDRLLTTSEIMNFSMCLRIYINVNLYIKNILVRLGYA